MATLGTRQGRDNIPAGSRARRSQAASRNMSACSWHAVSHSGCRLMVASRAKIRRPRCPAAFAGSEPFHPVQEGVDLLACGIRCRRLSATVWRRGAIVAILRHRSNDSDTPRTQRWPCQRADAMAWSGRGRNQSRPQCAVGCCYPSTTSWSFQRLFECREPLRARGRAALSARIERQPQCLDRDS